LSYADYDSGGSFYDRLRARLGQRTTGLVVALLLETLLILVLITLGRSQEAPKPEPEIVTTVDASPEAEPEPEPQPDEPQPADPSAPAEPQPVVDPLPTPPQAAPPPPAPVPLRRDLPSFDLARVPQTPARPTARPPAYGPADTGFPGDSKRVGTTPNGEPMYAAEWYREPDDVMLGNYLSTANGPGYALITCRTVPEWRVENCIALSEYPERSNMARAVLAAAWEFQVRPPRLRGRNMYGEWVRIRIDYTIGKPKPYQ
jgi:protein TonB